ncbi:MAG TPA: protein kinase [Thermomicrobiales bacterium]|nr:protein kinase [Thermomicrobiales bacterium]
MSAGGRVLNRRYRLDRQVGQGSFARVFLATDLLLERRVAVKLLQPDRVDLAALGEAGEADELDFASRFAVEARAVAALDHPNILGVYDYGEDGGALYLVMPFVDGGSLRDRIREQARQGRTVSLSEAGAYLWQAAAALDYAHRRNLVHRDIKPQNLLLRAEDNRLLLADFGIATLLGPAASVRTGVLGTLAYMAPEQLRGEVGRATDLYALGCVLFQLLTGDVPYTGVTAQIVAGHLEQSVPDLAARGARDLPPDLQHVLDRALAKDPAARFATAGDLAAAFQAAAGERLTARYVNVAAPYLPPATQAARREPQHNLPAPATPLVGRARDIAAVCALLRRPEVRLVSLTGPGGTGKTRLSLAVAADLLADFADGVRFVPLDAVGDPHLVIPTIAQTLGLREAGVRPIAERLKTDLREKELLLVLDNVEQVLDAAPDLGDLLAAAPRLKVLASSRAPLQLYGEQEYPVPPLPLPAAGRRMSLRELARVPAVALFVQRAQAVQPDFRLTAANAPAIATICARLDGLPLAIELAAARVKLLAPEAMLSWLDRPLALLTGGARDLPARQRTLRGAIEWSERLLSPAERRLFRRLAVFVGGFVLTAAEAVCVAAGDLGLDILAGLESLLDESLLVREDAAGEARFAMLQTIREYGAERLAESDEAAATRQAHALQYLRLAEAAYDRLTGAEQVVWLDRLEREHGNLRAALTWLIEAGEANLSLRLAASLWNFWMLRGYLSEGRRWLAAALAAGARGDPLLRASVLDGASTLARYQGDLGPGIASLRESLELSRALGDKRGIAFGLNGLAFLAHHQGDLPRARALMQEALGLFEGLGDTFGRALILTNLGLVARSEGNLDEAVALQERGLALSRELGERWGSGTALTRLGVATLLQGDAAQARTFLREALTLYRELGDPRATAECLEGLAGVAGAQGSPARAARLFGAAATLRADLGVPMASFIRGYYERFLAAARASADEAAFAAAWAEGEALPLDEVITYALGESITASRAG